VRTLLAESEDRELELLEALEPAEFRIESIKQLAQPGVRRRAEYSSRLLSYKGPSTTNSCHLCVTVTDARSPCLLRCSRATTRP